MDGNVVSVDSFSVIVKGEKDIQLLQLDNIKKEVSQEIIDNGGTITHHHGVGKDHRPVYIQQHTFIFGDMLKAAKEVVDPKWIMNPGSQSLGFQEIKI